MRIFSKLKSGLVVLKKKVLIVYFISRDSRTHWLLKSLAFLVVAYAFSPIDLIPDFIPILGLLDDFLLIPFGVWLILRFTPEYILNEASIQANQRIKKLKSVVGLLIVISIWLFVLLTFIFYASFF